MAGLLYFIPRVSVNTKELFRLSGLGDRLDQHAVGDLDRGPTEGGGIMFSADGHGMAYKPEEQTWIGPFGVGDAKYHIGMWNDKRPTPTEMQRGRMTAGTKLELLDGNEWEIPLWRAVPNAIVMTPQGEVSHEPLPLRLRLQGRIEQMAKLVEVAPSENGEESEVAVTDWGEMLRITADVLSVNYRISVDPAQELSLLRLVSTANAFSLIRVVTDHDFFVQHYMESAEKKTEDPPSGEQCTEPG